jgi:hypothetical protein
MPFFILLSFEYRCPIHCERNPRTLFISLLLKGIHYLVDKLLLYGTVFQMRLCRLLLITGFKWILVSIILFLRVLAPCRLVGRWQHFGETYCLHLQGWSGESTDESTRRQNPEKLHRHEKLRFPILFFIRYIRVLMSARTQDNVRFTYFPIALRQILE